VTDEWGDLLVENAVHLGIERLDHLFRTTFRYKAMSPSGFRVLVVEELEAVAVGRRFNGR
jgi:hypothetical protein